MTNMQASKTYHNKVRVFEVGKPGQVITIVVVTYFLLSASRYHGGICPSPFGCDRNSIHLFS